MSLKSYPYSSAVISARQQSLLTKEMIIGAASAETADSAMLSLKEKGYAKGSPELENPYEFETIVSYELDQTFRFLRKASPDEPLIELFLLKYDYLNAKILLKLDLLGTEFSEKNVTPYGTIPFELLKTSISEQYYTRLPEEMAQAMRRLDHLFAVNEDATLIGLLMDQAYAKHVARLMKDIRNPMVQDYFSAYFDFTNIIAVLRLRGSTYTHDVLDDVLLEGGRFIKSDLVKLFEDKSDGAFHYFLRFGYEKYLLNAFDQYINGEGLFAVEKARDDYLLAILKKDRYDVFSSAKALGFLIAKEREAAAVRMLMVAVLNNIGADEISRRLKDLYE